MQNTNYINFSPLERQSELMCTESNTAIRREDMALDAPNSDGNVWPKHVCPAFTPRGGAVENTCWYCVYADFHLDKPRALDVGICNWPKKPTEGERI